VFANVSRRLPMTDRTGVSEERKCGSCGAPDHYAGDRGHDCGVSSSEVRRESDDSRLEIERIAAVLEETTQGGLRYSTTDEFATALYDAGLRVRQEPTQEPVSVDTPGLLDVENALTYIELVGDSLIKAHAQTIRAALATDGTSDRTPEVPSSGSQPVERPPIPYVRADGTIESGNLRHRVLPGYDVMLEDEDGNPVPLSPLARQEPTQAADMRRQDTEPPDRFAGWLAGPDGLVIDSTGNVDDPDHYPET
jgi:hypothetical protein